MKRSDFVNKMELHDNLSLKIEYDTEGVPIYIRNGTLSFYPEKKTTPHWHDDLEMVLVTSGAMNYTVGSKTITLEQGNGIIINAQQFHSCSSISDRIALLFVPCYTHPCFGRTNPSFANSFPLLLKISHYLTYSSIKILHGMQKYSAS